MLELKFLEKFGFENFAKTGGLNLQWMQFPAANGF
jgi:hypothetical protein